MENKFKLGDRVFHFLYGWGTVKDVIDDGVRIYFDDLNDYISLFKKHFKLLSFTEYTLEGFSQERPEELPKKGQIVWVRDEFPSIWRIGHFYDKVDNKYQVTTACEGLDGWTHSGVEIRTTNPYEDEN